MDAEKQEFGGGLRFGTTTEGLEQQSRNQSHTRRKGDHGWARISSR